MTRPRSPLAPMLLLVLVGLAPRAQATVATCGEILTESITFDADIDCAGDGFFVGADKVKIDLNGFTLSGDGTGTGITNVGFDKVTVEDGMIEGFTTGIRFADGAEKPKITEVTVFGCQGHGIDLSGASDGKVSKCFLNGNGMAGLAVGDDSTDNKIEKTTAVGNGDAGFEVRGDDNVLKKVDAAVNQQGIQLLGDRNEVSTCTAFRNADHGIEVVGASNEVKKCDVAGNLVEGICVNNGTGNEIEKNVVTGNRQNGILVMDADGTVVKKNEVSANELDGIAIAADSDNAVVDGNESVGNHTDGIDTESASATIKKNEARANGELGIEADGGAVDGGGNEASDNADGGCTGVACT